MRALILVGLLLQKAWMATSLSWSIGLSGSASGATSSILLLYIRTILWKTSVAGSPAK